MKNSPSYSIKIEKYFSVLNEEYLIDSNTPKIIIEICSSNFESKIGLHKKRKLIKTFEFSILDEKLWILSKIKYGF